jgi:hypothetical protein
LLYLSHAILPYISEIRRLLLVQKYLLYLTLVLNHLLYLSHACPLDMSEIRSLLLLQKFLLYWYKSNCFAFC